jgi:hypothetical protein
VNKSQLAKALKVSPARITKLIRERRIADKKSYVASDVAAAKEMLAEGRANNPATAGIKLDGALTSLTQKRLAAQIKLVEAREAEVRQRVGVASGQLIDRETVDIERTKRVNAVKQKLIEVPLRADSIVSSLDTSFAGFESIIRRAGDALRCTFGDGAAAILDGTLADAKRWWTETRGATQDYVTRWLESEMRAIGDFFADGHGG